MDIILAGIGIAVVLGVAAAGATRHSSLSQCGEWEDAAWQAGLEGIERRRRLGWPTGVEGRRGPLRVAISGFGANDRLQMGTQIVVEGLALDLELMADPVIHLPGADVEVGDGRLVARRIIEGGAPQTAAFLRDVLRLAESLRPGEDVPAWLLANLRKEPVGAVRRTLLGVLVGRYPGHPATGEALRVAATDPDDLVQVDAAIALGGPEGRDALLDIVTNASSTDAAAARAVRELGSGLPVDRACVTAARVRLAGHLRTAEACLDVITHGGREHAAMVADILSREYGVLAVAAARALGRIGGRPAIAVLHDAEARLSANAELCAAVRDSVAAIHGRLVGAETGQVSMAAEGQGRISPAADDAGHLTMPRGIDEP